MKENYIIVLFKNKVRSRILKQYKTFDNALKFYEKKLKESSENYFEIKFENGRNSNYEIALLTKVKEKIKPIYKTDNLGRKMNVKIEDGEYQAIKIDNFKLTEKLFDLSKNKKISFNIFLNELKSDELVLVSKLNNKIVLQKEDDIKIFSLKSIYESERFIEILEKYMIENSKKNCLIVKDNSIEQKKYLYNLLEKKGFDKKMLYRTSTTHLKDK